MFGWFVGLVLLASVGGAGWLGVRTFREQDAGTSSGAGQPVGPAAVIGNAIDSVESLNNRYANFDVMLGETITLANVTRGDVLPEFVAGWGQSLEPVAGLERYLINTDDLTELEPQPVSDWLNVLLALPQDLNAAARAQVEGLLPVPRPHELAIAVAVDNGRVTRVVVIAVDPPISIDAAA